MCRPLQRGRAIHGGRVDVHTLTHQRPHRAKIPFAGGIDKGLSPRSAEARDDDERQNKKAAHDVLENTLQSDHTSARRPVLSPMCSSSTPTLSSRLRPRFMSGVSSGYLRWRLPFKRPEPPPTRNTGRLWTLWRSPSPSVAP